MYKLKLTGFSVDLELTEVERVIDEIDLHYEISATRHASGPRQPQRL